MRQRNRICSLLFLIGVPTLLVCAGDLLVLQKVSGSSNEYLKVGGDTEHYLKAIDGVPRDVDARFRYRVLVPWIARLLPVSPLAALKSITYVSLWGSYALILLSCSLIGLTRVESMMGLFVAYLSNWHLYNYHNPYLTDAFGLLVICGMTYSLLAGRFAPFMISAALGAFAREATAFMVPAWLMSRDRSRGAVVIGLTVIILAGLRVMFGQGEAAPDLINYYRQPIVVLLSRVFLSWAFIWITALAGLVLVSEDHFRRIAVTAALLLLGATVSALIVTDTQRMFSILLPVIAIATACFFQALRREGHVKLALTILVLCVVSGIFALPNRIYSAQGSGFNWPKLITLATGTIMAAWSALALKPALHVALRKKIAMFRA